MAVKFHGTNVVTQAVNNERGGSSWDLVLKVLSITLVSLFAFSSGIWFGKKLSDSDYQRQALEGEFDREVQKSSDSLATYKASEDDDVLTDEEVAAATDKAMEASRKTASAEPTEAKAHEVAGKQAAPQSSNATQAPAQAAHAPVAGSAATTAKAAAAHPVNEPAVATRTVASSTQINSAKPDLSAAHQAATRVANNAAPTNPAAEQVKTESRVPSSLPKTVGASADVEFTVQVASYPTAEAAKEHVEAMVKKGFPAFPVEAKINGKTWYRVSVGSFKSFNEASKFRAQLLKQADLPSAIVQKITR
jgi:cell division protein FtsN